MNLFSLSAICAVSAAALFSTAASAATAPASFDRASFSGLAAPTVLAREAQSGDDRGRGRRDDGKGHRLSDDAAASTVAREGETRGGDDGKGHRAIDDATGGQLVARNESHHGGRSRPAGKRGV